MSNSDKLNWILIVLLYIILMVNTTLNYDPDNAGSCH